VRAAYEAGFAVVATVVQFVGGTVRAAEVRAARMAASADGSPGLGEMTMTVTRTEAKGGTEIFAVHAGCRAA